MIIESNFDMPETGEYVATLKDIQDLGEQPDKFNEGQTRPVIKLIWDLGNGIEQHEKLRKSIHPSSKFFQRVTALMGKSPGLRLNTDALLGLRCKLLLEKNDEGWTNVKDSVMLKPNEGAGMKASRQTSYPSPPVPPGPQDITDDDLPEWLR